MRTLQVQSESVTDEEYRFRVTIDDERIEPHVGFMVGIGMADGMTFWAVRWQEAQAEPPEQVRLVIGANDCLAAEPDRDELTSLEATSSLSAELAIAGEDEDFEAALVMLDPEQQKWAHRGREFVLDFIDSIESDEQALFVLLKTETLLAVRRSLTLCRNGAFDPDLPQLVRQLLFNERENDFTPIPPLVLMSMVNSHASCPPGTVHGPRDLATGGDS